MRPGNCECHSKVFLEGTATATSTATASHYTPRFRARASKNISRFSLRKTTNHKRAQTVSHNAAKQTKGLGLKERRDSVHTKSFGIYNFPSEIFFCDNGVADSTWFCSFNRLHKKLQICKTRNPPLSCISLLILIPDYAQKN